MALLVPNIGELESLRYLIANNNHTPSLADQSPRNLVLKLFVSNTTPAEGDVPSATAYFEPLYRRRYQWIWICSSHWLSCLCK